MVKKVEKHVNINVAEHQRNAECSFMRKGAPMEDSEKYIKTINLAICFVSTEYMKRLFLLKEIKKISPEKFAFINICSTKYLELILMDLN